MRELGERERVDEGRGPAMDGVVEQRQEHAALVAESPQEAPAATTGNQEAASTMVATRVRPAKFRDRAAGTSRPVSPAPAGGADASARRLRGLLALGVAAVIVVVIVVQALLANGQSASPGSAGPGASTNNGKGPTLPAGALAPQAGSTLTAAPLIAPGGGGHLNDPHEAVVGPGGLLYVADPGAHAIVVYSRKGAYLRSITHGGTALKSPFSLAVGPNGHLYVLDSVLAHILEYAGPRMTFVRSIGSGPALGLGRGLAVTPNGHLYVINPATNSLTEFDSAGTVVKTLNPPLGRALGQFNQPSAVAGGPENTVFMYDNGNQRVEQFSATLQGVAQWPAPVSDTYDSVHVLVLGPRRFLVSDTHNGLLDYNLGASPATITRHVLAGARTPRVLGLAVLDKGHVLVTDQADRAVWSVPLPAAGQ